MIYIGIDPGLDGALAYISTGGDPEDVRVYDTPTLVVQGKNSHRRVYNLARMHQILSGIIGDKPSLRLDAYIENVHAMPGQGVRSMFTMGFGLGAWHGLLAALQIPYYPVTPQRWKKTVLDGMGHDKDASRAQAVRLFPFVADQLARKKDDGRADALLIAEYGRRMRS